MSAETQGWGARLASRKIALATIAILAIVLPRVCGVPLTPAETSAVMALGACGVLGQGLADVLRALLPLLLGYLDVWAKVRAAFPPVVAPQPTPAARGTAQ